MKAKEIDKLASTYADYVCPDHDNINAFDRGFEWAQVHDNARAMLDWLTETHFIVPKKPIKSLYDTMQIDSCHVDSHSRGLPTRESTRLVSALPQSV